MYGKAFAGAGGSVFSRTLRYGAVCARSPGALTTLAVSAKNVMASGPDYLLIETTFTIAQGAMVAPLTVLSMPSHDIRRRVAGADEKPIAAA